MTIYEKRNPDITSCTALAIESVELSSETECDASGGACIWIGRFTVKEYNIAENDTIIYEWATDVGAIQTPDDESTV